MNIYFMRIRRYGFKLFIFIVLMMVSFNVYHFQIGILFLSCYLYSMTFYGIKNKSFKKISRSKNFLKNELYILLGCVIFFILGFTFFDYHTGFLLFIGFLINLRVFGFIFTAYIFDIAATIFLSFLYLFLLQIVSFYYLDLNGGFMNNIYYSLFVSFDAVKSITNAAGILFLLMTFFEILIYCIVYSIFLCKDIFMDTFIPEPVD